MDNVYETIISLCRQDNENPWLQTRLKEVNENCGWNELILTADYNGLLPIVYGELEKKFKSLVPDDVFSKIKDRYMQTTINNINMANELVRIIGQLEKENIEALVFKGPVLSCSSYGDLTGRKFTDIDLMVYKHDIHAVRQILKLNGYVPQFQIRQDYHGKYIDNWYFENFYSSDAKTAVDLHWRTERSSYSFSLGFDELNKNSKVVNILNHRVRTFSDETNIIYLCQHGCKHGWENLVWILDIHRLAESREFPDWEDVFAKAEEFNSLFMVKTGLILSHKLFGTDLPDKTKKLLISDRSLDSFSENIISAVCCGHKKGASLFFLKQHDMVYLKTMKSASDRLLFTASFFQPTPLEWKLGLPVNLYFLYYLYRPFRVLKSKVLNK